MNVFEFESCVVVWCGVFGGHGRKGVQGSLLHRVCVVEFVDCGSDA